MRNKKQKIKNKKSGFTLIELIVAMAIFIVVISIVLSLFMTGLTGQRKIVSLQNIQDNARFLLEFMAKEIRMSKINSVSSTTLNLTRPDGEEVKYVFNSSQGNIERTDSSTSGVINSPEVSVRGSFSGLGVGKGDEQQPRLTINMKIETIGKTEERTELNIQTSLNPRNLDI